MPISYLDTGAMTRIFQAQVLQMLVREHRLSADFAARLRAWRHSGFQVYRGESVESDNLPALERLCAYIGRALFASTRVRYHPQTGNVSYRTAKGARLDLDALEWIALVTQYIPNPGQHLHHYYGHYSNAARGKRRKLAAQAATADPMADSPAGLNPPEAGHADTEAFRRECKRTWARLIQKVYQVNPLLCPDCGAQMRIVASIDNPSVIRTILQHLKLWVVPPRPPPAPLLTKKSPHLLPESLAEPDSAFAEDVPEYTR